MGEVNNWLPIQEPDKTQPSYFGVDRSRPSIERRFFEAPKPPSWFARLRYQLALWIAPELADDE